EPAESDLRARARQSKRLASHYLLPLAWQRTLRLHPDSLLPNRAIHLRHWRPLVPRRVRNENECGCHKSRELGRTQQGASILEIVAVQLACLDPSARMPSKGATG